jgi:Putative auto-transporter adhesin, head GIN domain
MTTAPAPIPRGHAPRRVHVVLVATLVVLLGTGVVLLGRHDGGSSSNATNDIRGSGVAATVTRHVPAFDAVDLAGTNNVTVHVGGRRTVVVRADANLIRLVTTEVRAGTLVVADRGSFTTKAPMSIEVTVPTLAAASLSGSGGVAVDGVEAARFTASLSGSGALTVTGTARRLEAILAGSGDLRLQGLASRDARATISGSGRLQVRATGTLHASVPGSGAIFYSGNPEGVIKSVTGSGTILG